MEPQAAPELGPEVPGEGIPTVPGPRSLAFPCPTDPGVEATKDVEDRARAPRDSEVSTLATPC